ncbi:MAG TPA: FtsX-like permease family protein [Thermoplasmata archaeon]
MGTGVFSFARYAFESVLRNRRRSLFSMMGIVLAISLIAGSSIAVDSSAYGVLRATLDSIAVDFLVGSYTSPGEWDYTESYFSPQVSAFESIRYVETASPMVSSNYQWDLHRSDVPASVWDIYDAVVWLPADSSRLIESHKITGQLPDPGTVAISETTATNLGVEVGDNVTLTHVRSKWDSGASTYTLTNFTLNVSQIWTQDPDMADPYSGGDTNYPLGDVRLGDSLNPVIINMADAESILSVVTDEDPYSMYVQVTIMIWVDRDQVINLGNIGASVDRLRQVYTRISYFTMSGGYYIQYGGLLNALERLQSDFESKKLLFFGLSLPVVALGTYLSLVGVDLGVTERRREVGILKSRGASRRQVFGTMITESIILGIASGISGLILGVLVSRFILGSAATLWEERSVPTQLTDVLVSEWTIWVVILFSIFLMVASSFRAMRRAARMDIAEALHQFTSKTTKIEYKPRWDIAALILVANSILSILWTPSGGFEYSGSFIVTIALGVLWIVGLSLLPAVPFLLAVSSVRLITRGSRKVYAKFTWLFRRWTAELHYLVDRNIVRNPKRASNVCIIVALALAFGLFISITMESYMEYQVNLVKYEVGADVKVEGYSSWNGSAYISELHELSSIGSIEGVDDHTVYYGTYLSFTWQLGGTAILMNALEYKDVVNPGDGFFPGEGARVLEQLHQQNGTMLVHENYHEYQYLEVGDTLHASLERYDPPSTVTFDLTIIGFFTGTPGMYADFLIDKNTVAWLGDSLFQGGAGAFVNVARGADHTEVGRAVQSVFQDADFSATIYVAEDLLNEMGDNPEFGPLRDFLYMEYALSFVIMTVGVGLIIFVTVWDRERELACIMARGASSSQMRKILMGESFTLMVIGLLVGVAVGVLTAAIFTSLLDEQFTEGVGYAMVVSKVTLIIFLSSIAAFVIATLLATFRAGKIKLAEVLRVRGG